LKLKLPPWDRVWFGVVVAPITSPTSFLVCEWADGSRPRNNNTIPKKGNNLCINMVAVT
jgi:hypothetical protein